MSNLKVLFERLGFVDVKIYIQRESVIFSSLHKLKDIDISGKVEKVISNKYRYDVPVIIRSVKKIEQASEKIRFIKKNLLMYVSYI